MDFNLTEERQMLQDSLRRFLVDHYDTETRNSIISGEVGYSPAIWAQMADLGIVGALFSERHGGFGGSGFDLSLVFEELGRAGVVEPFLETGVLAGGLIAELGTDEQKSVLQNVIAGTLQLAFAHGEPQSRYDLNHVTTTAEENADGNGFTLNGHKSVVINGGIADEVIVSARVAGDETDHDGISLFLINANQPGLFRNSYATINGTRACEVTLTACEVPVKALLGENGSAFEVIETQVARATTALCAEALGAMEAAKDLTVAYLQTRKQFGRPIGNFQALQHRMADLLIEVEQARSAVINACWHLEGPRLLRERHVSAAKHLVGRVGRLVAEETIQLHGGIGMTHEYALAHLAKRMVMIDHQFGDTDHHMERFITLGVC